MVYALDLDIILYAIELYANHLLLHKAIIHK